MAGQHIQGQDPHKPQAATHLPALRCQLPCRVINMTIMLAACLELLLHQLHVEGWACGLIGTTGLVGGNRVRQAGGSLSVLRLGSCTSCHHATMSLVHFSPQLMPSSTLISFPLSSPWKFYRSLFQNLPTIFMGVLLFCNSTSNTFFFTLLINLTKYRLHSWLVRVFFFLFQRCKHFILTSSCV